MNGQGCESINLFHDLFRLSLYDLRYRLVAKKGEGTFSEVLKAQNVKDGKYHAIKCMKNHFDSIDQVR